MLVCSLGAKEKNKNKIFAIPFTIFMKKISTFSRPLNKIRNKQKNRVPFFSFGVILITFLEFPTCIKIYKSNE